VGVNERTDALPQGREKTAAVREMFDRIAPRYDLLNRILTFGLDMRWRRRVLRSVGIGPGDVVADVACGSGDFCVLGASAGASVVGIDPSTGMLDVARGRVPDANLVEAFAETLPLADTSVDAVTCGFALRNFTDLQAALAEMARVLRPGGTAALLDVSVPRSRFVAWGHHLWFDRAVPLIGGLLSDKKAYGYLPASAAYLPPAAEMDEMLARAGFVDVRRRAFGLGAVAAVLATRGLAE